ncbi:MAG: serine protease [Elusimicrobiaceae bacterium]|nr:serine protease [Elusimicrobiaceae bacterium]
MNYLKYLFLLLLGAALPLSAQNVPGQLANAVERGISQTQLALERSVTVAKSVFRVYPQGKENIHALSGFVFKTVYNGKEEIFGVVATHGIPMNYYQNPQDSYITARMTVKGQRKDIPGKMVRVSSPMTLDMVLVKFNPEDEYLLTPLTLAEQEPEMGDKLQTIGFVHQELTFVPEKSLSKSTLISLRFPLGTTWRGVAGLCGSPVVNSSGEVVGMFTGTGEENSSLEHTGFATKSSYLHTLVAAYHNDPEKSTFPLMLGEHKIIDLHINDFISSIYLADEQGHRMLRQNVRNKFPYSTLMEQLPNARFITLNIYHNAPGIVYGPLETTLSDIYHVTYDLKEKTIIDGGMGMKLIPQ